MAASYVAVGKLRKPHGIRGAFHFTLNSELRSLKSFPQHFLLEERGALKPYFVATAEMQNSEEGFIELDEVTTREQAKVLSNSELFLKEEDAKKYFRKEEDGVHFLVGYKAIDEVAGELGTISDVLENELQSLVQIIATDETEIIVPLVNELIADINKRKKEIVFRLPEGLVEVYR